MPGTFVSFIKAGRHCIPIELYVIPSNQNSQQYDTKSSHWIETRHWDDVKEMLKPSVELGLKYNSEPLWETGSGVPRITCKNDIILGYIFVANKYKFTDLLDLRPLLTDGSDSDDDTLFDEHSGLKDYGGQFKRYAPTKVYIKACVSLRSGNDQDDEKRINKELGLKVDSYLNFFQVLSSKK